MKSLRLLLFPFSAVYWLVTSFRNILYNTGVFSSYEIPIDSICVGNLSVGGTGKSPLVILLAEYAINSGKKVAIISRGYGRVSRGLIEVNKSDLSIHAGDELLQYKNRFGDSVVCIASESRKTGVEYLLENYLNLDLILLDDAFQHRAVKAKLNILVTPYSSPFYKDWILPVGNLRESRNGSNRANIILVSKSPNEIPKDRKNEIISHCGNKTYFSSIEYGELIKGNSTQVEKIENILLVTGIGNPEPLVTYLSSTYSIKHLKFKDHHDFSSKDIEEIDEIFGNFAEQNKVVVTTEKDFMRLKENPQVKDSIIPWYYQEMNVRLHEEQAFLKRIEEYVR